MDGDERFQLQDICKYISEVSKLNYVIKFYSVLINAFTFVMHQCRVEIK